MYYPGHHQLALRNQCTSSYHGNQTIQNQLTRNQMQLNQQSPSIPSFGNHYQHNQRFSKWYQKEQSEGLRTVQSHHQSMQHSNLINSRVFISKISRRCSSSSNYSLPPIINIIPLVISKSGSKLLLMDTVNELTGCYCHSCCCCTQQDDQSRSSTRNVTCRQWEFSKDISTIRE